MRPGQAARGNWIAGVEAITILGLILLYIWWLRFRVPTAWMGILALVLASHVARRESLVYLGFSRQNLMECFSKYIAALIVLAAALLAIGLIAHTIRGVTLTGAFASFGLYCGWGLFQQYLLNAYFVNRFARVWPGPHARVVASVAACCFALAHLPNWFLMGVTLVGGYACARIYLTYRSLYFLGLAHGVTGFFIYLVVPDTISHHLYVGPKWF